MKWFRLVNLAIVALSVALASQASANPITVDTKGVSGVSYETNWVGPTPLLVTGWEGYSKIKGACFRADLSVDPPSWWTANVYRLDQVNIPLVADGETWIASETQRRGAAWLYEQFSLKPTSEWGPIQYALWALFQPSPQAALHGKEFEMGSLELQYYNDAIDPTKTASVDLAHYYVLLPTAGPTEEKPGGGYYSPNQIQPFITTPEPASLGLILMGSGLAALARRRRKA